VPSFVIPLWLLLAAAQADPLSPPPLGQKATVSAPTPPTAPSAKSPSMPTQPADPKAAKPAGSASPSKSVKPTGNSAKSPPRTETPATSVEVPEEEVVADPNSKSKLHFRRPPSRRPALVERTVDQPERPERKNPWSADRYAAVVPPGLTLAALRSQLAKTPVATNEAPAPPAAETGSSSQTIADIEKAREMLRQETARLEALLKSTGGCGAGGNMPIGEPLASASPLSPNAVREAPPEQIDAVSKAIKGMKPEQAAAMVGRLDRTLAAEILHRMKAVDAGAVLGLLKPELSAELATIIATRKSAPKDKKGAAK
jgi:flagellar motility protein MotE (MotC chaperone)